MELGFTLRYVAFVYMFFRAVPPSFTLDYLKKYPRDIHFSLWVCLCHDLNPLLLDFQPVWKWFCIFPFTRGTTSGAPLTTVFVPYFALKCFQQTANDDQTQTQPQIQHTPDISHFSLKSTLGFVSILFLCIFTAFWSPLSSAINAEKRNWTSYYFICIIVRYRSR